jgi:hypothetical protein
VLSGYPDAVSRGKILVAQLDLPSFGEHYTQVYRIRTLDASSVGSVLACALMDLACFLNEEEIYTGLRADILAAEICPRYYQICDTPGQFEYGATDIVRIPNVQFQERMTPFSTFEHGGHLRGDAEPRLATVLGPRTYVAASLLLRDRYFPKLWPMFCR